MPPKPPTRDPEDAEKASPNGDGPDKAPVPKLVEMGRVRKPHGLHGAVKFEFFGEEPSFLLKVNTLHLTPPGNPADPFPAKLLSLDPFPQAPNAFIATFRGYDTRTDAEKLRNHLVSAAREDFPDAGEDLCYVADLLGLGVILEDGSFLGTVTAFEDRGPAPTMFFATPDGKEIAIPWIEEFVGHVDTDGGTITVTPVPGLLEDGTEIDAEIKPEKKAARGRGKKTRKREGKREGKTLSEKPENPGGKGDPARKNEGKTPEKTDKKDDG
ncbi:MAG: ribosome maturation factor RimM [Deltaproteobacteria bacterium]|jgi:16S rRNA processing protein RimM|nr:ribosome maturation factor RimM [Deltaproteobacteria bacterium]